MKWHFKFKNREIGFSDREPVFSDREPVFSDRETGHSDRELKKNRCSEAKFYKEMTPFEQLTCRKK